MPKSVHSTFVLHRYELKTHQGKCIKIFGIKRARLDPYFCTRGLIYRILRLKGNSIYYEDKKINPILESSTFCAVASVLTIR